MFAAMLSKYSKYNKRDLFSQFALVFLLISLPLSEFSTRVAIILMVLAWVLNKSYRNLLWLLNYKAIALITFYLMYVIGMLYTEDKQNGCFQLEQKFSLLIFPLLLSTSPKINSRFIERAFMCFVGSCVVATLFCLFQGLRMNYLNNHFEAIQMEILTNQILAGYIGMHATYFSIYLLFAIFILLNYLTAYKRSTLKRIIVLFIISYLSYFILLLAARMVILAFFLICAGAFLMSLYKKRMKLKLIVIIVLPVFCVAGIALQTDYLKKRFQEVYTFNMSDLIGSNSENGVTQRIFLWQNAIEVIKKSPIIGSGTGDVNIEMDRQYKKLLSENANYPQSVVAAINSFAETNLNAHNQFIQVMMALGIFGLVILLVSIIIPVKFAFQKQQYLFLAFLALFFFSSFTECLLDRQSGVVFYAFFNSLFLFHLNSEN
ncbi:MAG: O-antigen ligase family protein [Bacteroidia bacterium]